MPPAAVQRIFNGPGHYRAALRIIGKSGKWQTHGPCRGGTGHWPVPSGDPPDGTGEALFLPADTVSGSAPRSAQPGW
jgi:hypothetical protein